MAKPVQPVRVLKFGGTSVQDAARIRRVADIVRAGSAEARCVVVVSAMGGVTGTLTRAAEAAAREDEPAYRSLLEEVRGHQSRAAEELAGEGDRPGLVELLDALATEVAGVLDGVSLVRECTPRSLDRILALGELASSQLVACALRGAGVDAEACDARRLLVTDDAFGEAHVDTQASNGRVREHFGTERPLQVVTGFIAGTEDGRTTTLGRGGSDYTATLLGAMLDAQRVEIWTDVDGVMSVDPRIVPGAFPLRALTYDELLELSHFGAKVVFPGAVHPARDRGVPLLIRNTLRPEFPGTWVGSGDVPLEDRPVRGLSCIRDVALLRLEGDGMVGVPSIAARLFRALAARGISVILISQASSEHSICFAVVPEAVAQARRGIEGEFQLELEVGLIDDVVVEEGRSVIAAVGEGMRDTPGLAGRVFSVLGDLGVNITAIAQGSSELNISLVVDAREVARALRGLHDAFFPHPTREVRVYLAGVGGVGAALLEQIGAVAPTLAEERGVTLRVAGLANSRTGACADTGIPLGAWRERLAASSAAAETVVEAAMADPAPQRVFVDCTASDVPPAWYPRLLDAGVSVVAANKRGFAGPYEAYRAARRPRPGGGSVYLEATVGAGLPVLRTLEALRATGDRIASIEGVLSGTLGFVFDQVNQGLAFSEAVRIAHARGYTEPDPREDLSGLDVARKLLILARESGMPLEARDVQVGPILPGDAWQHLSVDAFLEWIPEVDRHFARMRERALEEDRRLCHLAAVANGRAHVGVREIDATHPCHGLAGTDNLLAIRTDRYESPLVVRGPGAGCEVTAQGVFADVLRAAFEGPAARWRG